LEAPELMRKFRMATARSLFRHVTSKVLTAPIIPGAIAIAVLVFVTYHFASGQETLDAYTLARGAQQGLEISPVALDVKGRQARLVYLGSYLVNAYACNDCHTCPSFIGRNPYTSGLAGNEPTPVNSVNFLAGGTPFGAGTISSNLTPDASSGRPGGLTFAQFKDAMQNGHASKDGHILQVMPWPIYHNIHENDLNAIYKYLSSIPTASPGKCSGPIQTGS
jgi:hypothetical protein